MTRTVRCLLTVLVFLLALAPAAGAATGNRWIKKRPLNIAHQGGEDEFPSNTLYAFKKAVRGGADMLELDIGVTKDNKVVVLHDTTVDGKTNGTGTVDVQDAREIKRLDAAYLVLGRANHYGPTGPRKAYRFRGIATGSAAAGLQGLATSAIPTLKEVMRAFRGRRSTSRSRAARPPRPMPSTCSTPRSSPARCKRTKRRDLIVVSFKQKAVDRFHQLLPRHRSGAGDRRRRRLDLGAARRGRA